MALNNGVRNKLLDLLTVATALSAISLSGAFLWDWVAARKRSDQDGAAPVRMVQDWKRFSLIGHQMGNPDARLVLLEFGDYQCAACRVFQSAVEAAKREFGDSLLVVYRHLPLSRIHPLAEIAARAAECASDQERFPEFHSALFFDTTWLGLGTDGFRQLATEVGIPDSIEFSRCLLAGGEVETVERDRAAAEELGIAETPAWLINDRLFRGAVDSTTLISIIRGGK